jgi:adenylate cyclase
MRQPTLNQLYALTLVALAIFLGGLFYLVWGASRRAVVVVSSAGQARLAGELAARVMVFLSQAEMAVAAFERQVQEGTVASSEPESLERALLSGLLASEDLAELTLTHVQLEEGGAGAKGAGSAGTPPDHTQLLASRRGQSSVWRMRLRGEPNDPRPRWLLRMRRTFASDGAFVTRVRERVGGENLLRADFGEPQPATDPIVHNTFSGPLMPFSYGHAVWSDLHYAEHDTGRDERDRRIVVTLQKAILDRQGRLLGVLRVGLLTDHLDDATRLRIPTEQRVFICDARGALVSRWRPSDPYHEVGDDLRVNPPALPPEVSRTLALPHLREVSHEQPERSGQLTIDGRVFLYTLHALPRSQDWVAAIVVPRDHYLGALRATQERMLAGSLGLMLLILGGGMLTLRLLHRDLGCVVEEAGRMQRFEFAPGQARARLREVARVLTDLDQAKSALRALGKYAPMELVKQLYARRIQPEPGGELCEVTVLFSDIEGFTRLAEGLPPGQLAQALGRYFEVMAAAVHRHHGTIDKYIGDAVMALWNVPAALPDHAREAMAAVLACQRDTLALFSSPAWAGLPPLRTRFGLHLGTVMVGHFGAPDRLNYTALGDGVNLASRLEGLNQTYGTTFIVTEPLAEAGRGHFTFRLLDVVAVKGKTQEVQVHELVGGLDVPEAIKQRLAVYEQAFVRYRSRDFAGAAGLLEPQAKLDPPSAALLDRCRAFQAAPPPEGWTGVHVMPGK